jgi:hypothetical protein
MGPVITAQSKGFVESMIAKGADEGATVLVDGRGARISGYEAATSSARPSCSTSTRRARWPPRKSSARSSA